MFVPFVDLKTQYQQLESEINAAIMDVVSRTDFILGSPVREFESEFNSFLGSSYGAGVASGTDALHLALRSLGIGYGDEVITAANTYIATFLAISLAGAKPVPVDIDPDSYNLDPELLESAVTPRTKGIIAVHLFGQPAAMDNILEIANRKNVPVIEDACQAHGALYHGKKTGTMGDIGCFSFYPSKNLGCYGDGGYISTNNRDIADKIQLLRNYGQREKNIHEIFGINSRLDSVQASVLRVKLPHLDKWNRDRQRNAALYTKLLKDADVVTPVVNPDMTHVFHLYVIRTNHRDGLVKYLQEREIQTGIHYPVPPHLQKAYAYLGYGPGDFPVTEKYAREIISLPMYPEMKDSMIEYVVEKIKHKITA